MRLFKPLILASLIIVVALAASTNVQALEAFKHVETKSFEIGEAPQINIEALNGDVSYKGADGSSATVEIVFEIRAEDLAEADEIREQIALILDAEPGFLELRMDNTRDFYERLRDEYSREHNVSVGFHVTGPRGAEGLVASVSGDASVSDVRGPIEVSSVSGDARASDIQRAVRANSTSGDVDVLRAGDIVIAHSVSGEATVTGCGGDLDIESTSGEVVASDVKGTVSAESVSGDIDLRGVAHAVDAGSVSGSIRVENLDGEVTVSTTSGDIEIMTKTDSDVDLESLSGTVRVAVVPEGFGQVSLSASSGDIASDIPISVKRKTRGRLQGTLGTGTATLRVSTSSGDIVLNEL